MKAKRPPGPPMDLANMRDQGEHHLIGFSQRRTRRIERANVDRPEPKEELR